MHKELERVEQGLGTVHTGASLTPDSTADTTHVHHPLPHHPSDISYSAEELALQAFSLPTNGVQQHSCKRERDRDRDRKRDRKRERQKERDRKRDKETERRESKDKTVLYLIIVLL